MAHVRIRCRQPKQAASLIEQKHDGRPYPLINGLVASWEDVEVHLIEDDGTERAWIGVKSVEWSATVGDEPITAKVELYNVEIDVMAEAEINPLAARILDLIDETSDGHHDVPREILVRRIAAAMQGKIGTVE